MGWKPTAHDEDHAARHADGGADELDAADLASGAATDGQVLTADGAGGAAWEDASGGASALNDLSDVTITSPSSGQVVKYNGSAWVNDTDSTGSGLPTASTKGDIAVYNGSSWVIVAAGTNDHVLTADSAQTAGVKWAAGGGSSVTPLDPDDISDLEVWVEAGDLDGSLADGDPVATWSDKSGNSADFTQSTSANRPTLQKSEANSLSVIRFDASNDGMEGGPNLSNPFSIFYVCRFNGASSANRRAIQGNSNNWLLGPYQDKWQWFSGGFAGSLGSAVGIGFVIHGVVQESGVGRHFLWTGDTTFPLSATTPDSSSRSSPGAIGQMALGASGAFSEPGDCDIAEIAAYSRALTTDEGYGLLESLKTKYAL